MAKKTANRRMSKQLFGLNYPSADKIASRTSTVARAMASTLVPIVDASDDDINDIKCLFEGTQPRCVYCGCENTTNNKLQLDHLFSLVGDKYPSGFCTEPANLVPCCSACNGSKGAKPWYEYMNISNYLEFSNLKKFLVSECDENQNLFQIDELGKKLNKLSPDSLNGLLNKIRGKQLRAILNNLNVESFKQALCNIDNKVLKELLNKLDVKSLRRILSTENSSLSQSLRSQFREQIPNNQCLRKLNSKRLKELLQKLPYESLKELIKLIKDDDLKSVANKLSVASISVVLSNAWNTILPYLFSIDLGDGPISQRFVLASLPDEDLKIILLNNDAFLHAYFEHVINLKSDAVQKNSKERILHRLLAIDGCEGLEGRIKKLNTYCSKKALPFIEGEGDDIFINKGKFKLINNQNLKLMNCHKLFFDEDDKFMFKEWWTKMYDNIKMSLDSAQIQIDAFNAGIKSFFDPDMSTIEETFKKYFLSLVIEEWKERENAIQKGEDYGGRLLEMGYTVSSNELIFPQDIDKKERAEKMYKEALFAYVMGVEYAKQERCQHYTNNKYTTTSRKIIGKYMKSNNNMRRKYRVRHRKHSKNSLKVISEDKYKILREFYVVE